MKPITLEQIKKKHKAIYNPHTIHTKSLSKMDKVALWITNRVGSMWFFLIIFVRTLVWLGRNTFGPIAMRFDPFPAFVLWLFLANVIQILLMPLIMVGQNLQSWHSEARAQADFDVNVKSEEEIEAILLHLENQNQLMLKILEKIENK